MAKVGRPKSINGKRKVIYVDPNTFEIIDKEMKKRGHKTHNDAIWELLAIKR